jgi:hypothetical protein
VTAREKRGKTQFRHIIHTNFGKIEESLTEKTLVYVCQCVTT